MIYLYGLSDVEPKRKVLTQLSGVTGPVETAETECGWLVFGPSDGEDLLPKRRHLLAHTRVLEDLGHGATILPMRFGMMAQGATEFAHLVAENAPKIHAIFERLQGRVELGLRVEFPRDEALAATLDANQALASAHARLSAMQTAPHFEAAEFGRRLAEALDTRRAQTQRSLVQALKPLLADFQVKPPESDVQVLAVDILIAENAQDDLTERLSSAVKEVAEFATGAEPIVRIIGPVPPFSFVDLTLTPAEAA